MTEYGGQKMDISQLRYFIGVCESESMAQAAQKLHLSQQGLSVSIRRMETELGCILFYRKSNGVVLTEVGKAVRDEAREIIRRVDSIHELCAAQKTAKDGRFQINCAVADSLIVRLPAGLQRLLINGDEEYNVVLSEGYSSECVDRVNKNEAVFAIVYGNWDSAKYDTTELDVIKQVWIVNRKHPWANRDSVKLADLDGVPICASDDRSRPRQELNKMFEKAGVRMNVAYTCNRPRVTVDLISNNPQLIARTIAEEITSRDQEKIKVLELEDEPFLISVSLVSRKSRKLTIQERYFKHMVLETYDQ